MPDTHLVHELVRVNLESERGVEDAQPSENAEEVVVTPKEYVQSHLDVIPVFVLPAAHLLRAHRITVHRAVP